MYNNKQFYQFKWKIMDKKKQKIVFMMCGI